MDENAPKQRPIDRLNAFHDQLTSLSKKEELTRTAFKDLYQEFGFSQKMANQALDALDLSLTAGKPNPNAIHQSGDTGKQERRHSGADGFDAENH